MGTQTMDIDCVFIEHIQYAIQHIIIQTNQLSMQSIPEIILKNFEILLENQNFLDNLQSYTQEALTVIYGTYEQASQLVCPTAYFMIVGYCIRNCIELDILTTRFPEPYQQVYQETIKKFDNKLQKYKQQNLYVKNQEIKLCEYGEKITNVTWNCKMENAKQIWEVEIVKNTGTSIRMNLNYSELTMLVFKLGQLVKHISSVDPWHSKQKIDKQQ